MPPAETPDFDSMSPEEVMAWMESLAKRQGANEGFTTEADVDIAEVDPTSVQIEEPGYVPFGEESAKPAAKAEPAQSEPEPETILEPEPAAEPEPELELPSAMDTEGMAWLESLAADQSDSLPDMDLAALSAELDLTEMEAAEPVATNPMDWLENLTEDPDEITQPIVPVSEEAAADPVDLSTIDDPLEAGVDPMLWLESLAKRQGANTEELTTNADMEIPVPDDVPDAVMEDTLVDAGVESQIPAEQETTDPAAWLESMATGSPAESYSETSMSDDEIQHALSSGADIPPEQMEAFLGRQLDRQLAGGDVPIPVADDYDPDAPAVPAELPDWLLEQVQPPDEPIEDHQPALVEDIVEPPDVEAELPDWLQGDDAQDSDPELESIFETDVEAAAAVVDESDPWVQAFNEEAETNPDEVPEWYEQNLRDPARIAAVEKQLHDDVEDVELPVETGVPEGELEASIPDWLSDSVPALTEAEPIADEPVPDWLQEAQAEAEASTDEVPDWLADTNADVEPDEIPAWLLDTVETDEADEELIIPPADAVPLPVLSPIPETTPLPAAPPPVPTAPSVPVQAVTPAADVAEALASARAMIENNDMESGLQDYERVVRANGALDEVASDLNKLAQSNPNNPAIYRILGDCFMRQGKLQAALDTYRQALNQL